MEKHLLPFLLSNWDEYFFTVPLLIISQIVVLTTYYKHKKNNLVFKPFTYYIYAGLLLFFLHDIIKFYVPMNSFGKFLTRELFNAIFTITEIFSFGHFYINTLKTKKINTVIIIFILAYSTLFIGSFLYIFTNKFTTAEVNTFFNKLAFFELIFWGLLGVLYFFELFKYYSNENLLSMSSFWIISFSLFYTLIFPVTFLALDPLRTQKIEIFRILVSLHYISLILLNIGISKAILCNSRQNN